MLTPDRGRRGGGVAGGCNAPTRNLQNIKHKHADQPSEKTCDTLPDLRVASVEQTGLETTHCEKCVICVLQDVSCGVTERAMC
jgi:hypothetical protein